MITILPNLPMIAFEIKGYGEKIKLQIDEVWGFPDQTDYAGGYGASGIITIKVGNYTVANAKHYFSTGELYQFYTELQKGYNELSGCAELKNFENEMQLKCSFDKLGHVEVMGSFREVPHIKNTLEFELITDQTQIAITLSQLKKVVNIFGDNLGIKGK